MRVAKMATSDVGKPGGFNSAQREVINDTRWIEAVVTTGLAIAGLVVLIKLATSGNSFEVFHVGIPLDKSWVVFLCLTIAHLYTTYIFSRALVAMWKNPASTEQENLRVFAEITVEGSPILRGIIPRVRVVDRELARVYIIDSQDPTGWLAYAGAVGLISAVVPFHFPGSYPGLVGYFLVALGLVFVNWITASHWIIALSLLTQKKDEKNPLNDYQATFLEYILPKPSNTSADSYLLVYYLFLPFIFPFAIISWLRRTSKGLVALLSVVSLLGILVLLILLVALNRYLAQR
jgi:hypothetical protein